jgi:hypothetical protein
MPEIIEAVTKKYFGCTVMAYRLQDKYHMLYPWRFSVEHNGVKHEYSGIPNYSKTKAAALKRGWYRAKWFSEGTYSKRYTPLQII